MKTQKDSLKITMYCDGFPFDGNTINEKSLGGTETAALQAAKEFAKQGHEVVMVNNCQIPGIYDKVKYVNANEFNKYFIEEEHDVSLIIRHPELFAVKHNSKINILWQHDLAFTNEKDNFLKYAWNIDSVWCQSPFHKKQYQSVMGLSDDLYWVAGSAIDPELFSEDDIGRDKKKLVYTGRPERGLEVLATEILPRLLKYDPELILYTATYDCFPPQVQEIIDRIKLKTRAYKDNIVWLPPLSKKELYELFQTSWLYLYPVTNYDKIIGNFEETYCLSVDECMASGLPFISRPVGAIPDTLDKNAGVLIDGKSNRDKDFQDSFAMAVIDVLEDDMWHKNMSNTGKGVALTQDTWEVRVKGFIEKINSLISDSKQEKLSVCILTRPEDKPYLRRCLKSIKRIDEDLEIVVKTCNEDSAQNELFNQAVKDAKNDWFLWLYGSEELQNSQELKKYIKNNIFNGYQINKTYMDENRIDLMEDNPPRLFRKDCLLGFLGNEFSRPVIKLSNSIFHKIEDVQIVDFSMKKDDVNSIKYYLCNYPNKNVNSHFFLMKTLFLEIKEELAKTGFVNQHIEDNCREIIKLYKKHFYDDLLDNINITAVRMYSEANRILGEGFQYRIDSQIFRSNNDKKISQFDLWFSSRADAKHFYDQVFEKQVDSITNKYYLVR